MNPLLPSTQASPRYRVPLPLTWNTAAGTSRRVEPWALPPAQLALMLPSPLRENVAVWSWATCPRTLPETSWTVAGPDLGVMPPPADPAVEAVDDLLPADARLGHSQRAILAQPDAMSPSVAAEADLAGRRRWTHRAVGQPRSLLACRGRRRRGRRQGRLQLLLGVQGAAQCRELGTLLGLNLGFDHGLVLDLSRCSGGPRRQLRQQRVELGLEPGGLVPIAVERLPLVAQPERLVVVVPGDVGDVHQAVEEVGEAVGLEQEDDGVGGSGLVEAAALDPEQTDVGVVLRLDLLAAGVERGNLPAQLVSPGELALIVGLFGVEVGAELVERRPG